MCWKGLKKKNHWSWTQPLTTRPAGYIDADGFLEHSPSGASLYHKGPALQKTVRVFWGSPLVCYTLRYAKRLPYPHHLNKQQPHPLVLRPETWELSWPFSHFPHSSRQQILLSLLSFHCLRLAPSPHSLLTSCTPDTAPGMTHRKPESGQGPSLLKASPLLSEKAEFSQWSGRPCSLASVYRVCVCVCVCVCVRAHVSSPRYHSFCF